MANREGCGGGLCKLVVGGLIGAGIALLLAPQAGRKTRKYLACCAKDFSEKANEAVSEFSDTLSDFVDKAGDRASEFIEEAGLSKESKKALLAALEKGQEKLEEQRKRLADLIG